MVLADSDVWSEAFRKRGRKSQAVSLLEKFIENDEVIMIGTVRQEMLSGIKEDKQFEKIRDILKAFPSQLLEDSIFELAASFFNICRRNGIQGSHTDFLLCACSVAWKVKILTKDKDFQRFSNYISIELVGLKVL
jgi:hypothetical protein